MVDFSDPKILAAVGGAVVLLIGIIVVVILLVKGDNKKGKNDIKTGVKEIQKEEEKPLFQLDLSGNIPSLPDIKDVTKIDIKYPLIPPYTFAHIHWDAPNTELVYEIEEPVLNDKEKETLDILEEGIRELINLSYIGVKDKNTILIYLEKNVKILLTELSISLNMDSYLKIMYYIYRDFVGMNELEPLMNDYYIEDVECNGVQSPVYVVHRKYRNIRTNLVYKSMRQSASFVEKLAQKAGKYVSYAEPLLDGTLPDGSRVNATYSIDVSSKGPTFCFADGYLQLGDGNVVNIKKLFEECKDRFGIKKENGNEIVDVHNMTCCGVNENNLVQKHSILKTVMKLCPPEKLVDIELEDGSSIKVTTNHLFHIFEDDLKLIEAENLKNGMIVPIPVNVNVEGCLQTINTYQLLKEFSYSHKICICTNKIISNLVNNLVANNTRTELSRQYQVNDSYFYEIVSRGNSISFEVLESLCKNKNTDINSLGNVGVVVYGGGTKGKSKTIKVPDTVNEELAYLAGAIISDGHLSENSVDVACYNDGFASAVSKAFENNFKLCESYYNGNRIYLSNKFAPFFFNKVFGVPYGKKTNIVKVPEIIFKSNNIIVSSFIKGLFDGDGTCSSGVSYKTNSKELAEGLSYLLARLGIYSYLRSNNKEYKVTIPSNYERVYHEKIGFCNSIKKEKLFALINKKKGDREFSRHGRVPAKPFIDAIKKAGLSKNEISKKLNTSYNRLLYYDTISKPFAKDIIRLISENKRYEQIKLLNWLVDCNQEFVRIKSVNVIKNREKIPVYDIELEPCKFFIAGNKPMNVFDTIRKFTKEPWSPVQLVDKGTVSAEILAYAWMCIEYENSFMVVGGTGSGKTSYLNAVAFFIPPQARVVSIEDTRELSLEHENWLPSVSRAGVGLTNILGQRYGEVSLFDLLKESFRQRPDYIIVGEVRGAEAYILFQGMASVRGDQEVMVLNSNHPKKIAIKDMKDDVLYKAITIDRKTNKTIIVPISKKIIHPARDILYKIVTRTGREVITTPDHSLFDYDIVSKSMIEKIASELKEGSDILIPGKVPCGYADIKTINLIEILPEIRVFSPELIKKASEILGFKKASITANVKTISDYYCKKNPSSLKSRDFIRLVEEARIKYNPSEVRVKFLRKSKMFNGSINLSDELLRLMGYFISEGSLNSSGKNSKISLYNKNQEVLKDMEHCIQKLISELPKKRATFGYGVAVELSFSHKVLFELLKELCGKKERKIPDFIFGLNEEKIGEFLSGLYTGDGSFTNDRISYYTISKKLANDVSYLLLCYGIVARINKRNRAGRKTTDYEIMFYTQDEKDSFMKYVKPIGKKISMSRKNKANENKVGDLYIDSVKSIEKIKLEKPEPVYDISVPGTQNFIGGFGGIILHNSGHPSMGTMHAENVQTMIRRLKTPPINLSGSLVMSIACVFVQAQTKVKGKEVRRMASVDEIVDVKEGDVEAVINNVFKWDPNNDSFIMNPNSKVFDNIALHYAFTKEQVNNEFRLRTNLLKELLRRRIVGFKEVQKIIQEYYKEPAAVLRRFSLIK